MGEFGKLHLGTMFLAARERFYPQQLSHKAPLKDVDSTGEYPQVGIERERQKKKVYILWECKKTILRTPTQ